MPIKVCPNCGENYVVGFDTTDYVHDCSQTDASTAVTQDDIVVTGKWEDFTSSGTVPAQAVMRQGAENEFFGTQPAIEGEDKEDETPRGNRASTHRQRKHLEYIKIK